MNYGDGFTRADFQRLADRISGIFGQFILSINDTAGAREMFEQFQIDTVKTTYTIGTAIGSGKRAGELVVSGPAECLTWALADRQLTAAPVSLKC